MRLLLTLATVLSFTAAARAAEVNIAQGKSYTLSKKPNYALCTDAGDKTDLTDGKNFRSEDKQMWVQKGCVGWTGARQPVAITVDLGQDQPIAGVSFSTAAGGGGVGFPSSIAVSVSTDGKTFHTVGDLIGMEESALPTYGRGAAHLLKTTRLQTHGRYVRFSAIAATVFLFCDEVEVYRGKDEWLKQPLDGPVLSDAQLTDPLRLTQLGVQRRLKADWAMVRSAVEKEAPAQAKGGLLKELDALKEPMLQSPYPQRLEGFRAMVPVNDWDARILAVRGKLLVANGAKPLTLWHSAPYQLLELLQPIPAESMPALEVKMLGNEHRAEAFNLTNASAEAREVSFTIDGLPDGAVQVFQVETVDTRENRPVATALTPLQARSGQYTTTVPAGMTRQVWLSFDSKSVPAGQYSGQIHLPALDRSIPLKLSVASVRLADDTPLATAMWDYISTNMYGITEQNKAAARADMIAHDVNVVWSSRASTPLPEAKDFDADGNLKGKINYDKWDAFVKFWPGARYYMTFAAYPTTANTFAGMKLGTPKCDRALAQWAADWARHNRELGLKPKQAAICFIDEPGNEAAYTASFHFIKPFGDGTEDILTFSDPGIHNVKQLEQARPLLEAVDIIEPTRAHYDLAGKKVQEAYRQLQAQGKQLWFYMCTGPTRQFDPAYFRLQPWHCFAAGATGSGFWAYGDNGKADSWNPYTAVGATSYTPVYLGPDSVASSKHWEALREGIEDYAYLSLLAQKGADARQLARSTLEQVVKLHGIYYSASAWGNPSLQAEAARLKVLSQLAQ